MATFMERKGRVTALIRKKYSGKCVSHSKTFGTMEEAKKWADETEAVFADRVNVSTGVSLPAEVVLLERYKRHLSCCGVYFLFDGNECVYVGQSKQVHTRVREHKNKQFDSYAYIEVEPGRLDEVETFYIRLLSPKLNESMNPSKPRSKSWRSVQRKKLPRFSEAPQVVVA